MKKTNFLIVLGICFLLCSTFFTTIPADLFEENDEENLIFEFTFPEPDIIKYDENFEKIIINDLPNTQYYNKPCLPIKPLKILLPQGTNVENIKVLTGKQKTIGSGYNIQISGKLLPIEKLEKKAIKKEPNYESSEYINPLYEKIGIYNFRGFSILHMNLYPILYNKKTGKIIFNDYMKIIIETKESDVKNTFRGLLKDCQILENIVDNPSLINTYKTHYETNVDENYDYIIITNNRFKKANGEFTFQDLLDYKESKGLKTKIVTVGEIILNPDYSVNGEWGDNNPNNPFYQYEIVENSNIFDDTPARIRNFIRYAYITWGIDYVLLAGDADIENNDENIIPSRGLFANESGLPLEGDSEEVEDDIPSDVYYACLDGNFNYDCDDHFGESKVRNDLEDFDEADLYAEVWVGRACVDSEEEISNFVKKTLYQEENSDDYISEILFIGEDLGTWYDFYYRWGGDYKDDMVYLVPDQYNLHFFYDRDYTNNHWLPSELYDEILNIQPQIINHDGHGYTNYMLKMGSNTFYEFENEKPFFIYSHSCLTGSFDNFVPGDIYLEQDCIAEIITCEIPYGAFACILNARYGLGSENDPVSPSGAYDESFYKALFEENIKNLGHANHYSKEDNVWRIDQNGYRWCYYQTNLFGDPELRIKDPEEQTPTKPVRPSGESQGKINVEYTFISSSTDPNGKELYYKWDFGDGTISEWIGPYNSGESCDVKHTWNSRGDFQIKVIAKNSYELVSEWSDPLSVSMPKSKFFIFNFLHNLIDLFPNLKILF